MNKNKLAVRVMDNDDYNDDVADTMIIEISPKLKEHFLNRRKQLMALRETDTSIYEITAWDFSPKFLMQEQFGELTDYKYDKKIEEKEAIQLTDEEFEMLSQDDVKQPFVDVVLMHVKEDGVRWTGVYKYSNTEFFTGTIPFSLIESL